MQKKLFEAMIPLNKKWGGQMSIDLAKDDELLELAVASGCLSIFIGIESINTKNIRHINKAHVNKVDEYTRLLGKIRAKGIEIFGSFIVGLDEDTEESFEDIYNFIKKNDINFPAVSILTPFPGTYLYKQMDNEGLIIDRNWDRYNLTQAVYRPKNMSTAELQFMYNELVYKLTGEFDYSLPAQAKEG